MVAALIEPRSNVANGEGLMNGWEQAGARLALLVDPDRETSRTTRSILMERGLELVQARAGVAALELIQRMPSPSRSPLSVSIWPTFLAVVIETLRHFRPEIPVVCLAGIDGSAPGYDAASCLSKPIRQMDLLLQLEGAITGTSSPLLLTTVDPEAVERARWRFTESGDLLQAAREIARGLADYSGE